MFTVRHYFLLAFIAFHVFYVYWRTTPFVQPSIPKKLTGFWETYGNLTGANTGYSFFAPSVASQMILTNSWVNDAGRTRTEVHDGRHGESELRLTAMALSFEQLNVPDLSARAVAVSVFNGHPDARRVTVSIGLWVVPTMAQYRHGYRPFNQVFYRGTFVRRSDLETPGALPTP